jgi:cold shock CspA family protein
LRGYRFKGCDADGVGSGFRLRKFLSSVKSTTPSKVEVWPPIQNESGLTDLLHHFPRRSVVIAGAKDQNRFCIENESRRRLSLQIPDLRALFSDIVIGPERDVLMSASSNNYTPAKIVWFNNDKGFGYAQDSAGNLIFVHESAIASDAQKRRHLEKEQEVELKFTEELGELRATKVRDVGGHA